MVGFITQHRENIHLSPKKDGICFNDNGHKVFIKYPIFSIKESNLYDDNINSDIDSKTNKEKYINPFVGEHFSDTESKIHKVQSKINEQKHLQSEQKSHSFEQRYNI